MHLLQYLLVSAIRLYRWLVSPVLTVLFNPQGLCRFQPSCSEYALEAVQRHGPFRGVWLALRRLLRCHPWGPCGHDPVPPVPAPAATAHSPFTPGSPLTPPKRQLF